MMDDNKKDALELTRAPKEVSALTMGVQVNSLQTLPKQAQANFLPTLPKDYHINVGASREEWIHCVGALNVKMDILPVVADTSCAISKSSSLTSLGKVPSCFNPCGDVIGIKRWATRDITRDDINKWAIVPEYGICIRTRSVRALDIDVDDPILSKKICECINEYMGVLGYDLPTRFRDNSGRSLLALRIDSGKMPKRKMCVEGGIIELLATGQQFVAFGTHPSGARYEWVGGLPHPFPSVPICVFDELWAMLEQRFSTGPTTTGRVSLRSHDPDIKVDDPVADYIRGAKNMIVGETKGALTIVCPWASEHTSGDDGDGSTTWFIAGSHGYASGHFKCLHAHCVARTDMDFHSAIGYRDDVVSDFDVIPVFENERELKLKRNKSGSPLAIINNVTEAIRRPELCGLGLRDDTFSGVTMRSSGHARANKGQRVWKAFEDTDYTVLHNTLERDMGFCPIREGMIKNATALVAHENRCDGMIDWIDGLKWDGVERIDTFMTTYFKSDDRDGIDNIDDSEYLTALSRYMWSALAGRIVEPGVKCDMIPVFIGPQGVGKSIGIQAMCPTRESFTEISFTDRTADMVRMIQGRVIGEISELRGLHTRDLETIKAFVTVTSDSWIPKYREKSKQSLRRIVLIGTTNSDEFLSDDTGNRRWLPARVGETGQIDIAAIKRDRDMLWAEAKVLFGLHGIEHVNVSALVTDKHAEHTITDNWIDIVRDWINEPDILAGTVPCNERFLRLIDIASGALSIEPCNFDMLKQKRLGSVMRRIGYSRKAFRVKKTVVKGWVRFATGYS